MELTSASREVVAATETDGVIGMIGQAYLGGFKGYAAALFEEIAARKGPDGKYDISTRQYDSWCHKLGIVDSADREMARSSEDPMPAFGLAFIVPSPTHPASEHIRQRMREEGQKHKDKYPPSAIMTGHVPVPEEERGTDRLDFISPERLDRISRGNRRVSVIDTDTNGKLRSRGTIFAYSRLQEAAAPLR